MITAEANAEHILVKPFSTHSLQEKLEKIFKRSFQAQA